MRRLVYAPYVQAFIKADHGVVDISPYLVRGSVNRKVSQVSTAQLTLRNPVRGGTSNLLFTEYQGPGDAEPGPMFHPMDPIIIVMQRLQGHQVQVFTGYLDKAPYFQLYPGLCSIEASCTLKRLLYTQWDASLPAVQDFLVQFGWIPNGSGVWNPGAEAQRLSPIAGQLQGQFNDGSIGALLFAVLNIIGNWDHSTIWIEALPPQIKDIVVNLYKQISPQVQQGEAQFQSLIQQVLGSSAQGSGAPTASGQVNRTGNITNTAQIVPTMVAIAKNHNLPPLFVVTTWLAEGQVTDDSPNGSNARGYFQFTTATPYSFYTTKPINYPQDAADLGIACNLFCAAAEYAAKSGLVGANFNVNNQSNWQTWAETVQKPGAGAYSSYWSGKLQQAQQLLTQYGNGTPVGVSANLTGAQNTSLPPNAAALTPMARADILAQSGRSPGGKSGTTGASTTPVFPLKTGTFVGQSSWSQDQGVDISTNGGACGPNAPLLAIGDGTVVVHGIGGFGPWAPVLKLDTPIQGQNYVYYGHAGSSLLAPIGTHLSAGQVIGSVGCGIVGISTGPHLEIGFSDSTGTPVSGTSSVMFDTLKSAQVGQPVSGGGAQTGSNTNPNNSTTMAAAFSTFINLPSVFNMAEAVVFTGKRSFIADQPLFPFIDQLCKASLRNFMSMPNGNFFAFFPDYFGFFGRKYYWELRDIEIIDGRIDLSDDSLITHMAVAGDVTQYHGTVDFWDLVLTSGIFDIFDAFATGYVGNLKDPATTLNGKDFNQPAGKAAALAFLQKYGARPYVDQVPAIRSPFFELFLAFQNFMIAWSKQFQTTFELTFMPELFPGGLIALPDHHLQCYVEEVAHTFDYEQGFTTTVSLSSPSQLLGDPLTRKNVSAGPARPPAVSPAEAKQIGKDLGIAGQSVTRLLKQVF